MKKMIHGLLTLAAFFLLSVGCKAGTKTQQDPELIDKVISVKEVRRVEEVLASDAMRGRRAFTPDIEKAADFIAAEFKTAGLESLNGDGNYRQAFTMVRTKPVTTTASMEGQPVDARQVIVVSCLPVLKVNQQSGYEKVFIKPGASLQTEARQFIRAGKNLLVLVNKSFANSFGNLARLRSSMFKTDKHVVFVLTDTDPSVYEISMEQEVTEHPLSNVVGVIPGKSKKDEFVIFSGHYDHIGVGKPVNGDSIYNGANDDAAGVTAVIMLARYYKSLGNNERTLVFTAFTAEEVGGFGSQYFSRQFDPAKVMAMFNIEMIGTESKWGKNSAFITGYEKTDMGTIMQKNLEGTGFVFHPDPYPNQQLFYRSDNATLARLGVPAHTISTAKMENELHYHKVSDEVSTLDLDNMTEIIKSIALSARGIVAGKETPARVKVEELR